MHNKEKTFVKMSDLKQFDIVKSGDPTYKWLLPFVKDNNLRFSQKAITPENFVIRDIAGQFENLILVRQLIGGRVQIDGYKAINCKLKEKARKRLENQRPFFSFEVRSLFGKISVENFRGEIQQKDIQRDIEIRIIPVLIYMQQFFEHAEKHTKKVSKSIQNIYTLKRVNNEIPKTFYFDQQWVDVKETHLLNLSDIRKKECIVTINTDEDARWLQEWAKKIRDDRYRMQVMHLKRELKYPIYDASRDLKSASNVSVLYVKTDDQESYMQLQIEYADKAIQLNYYDETSSSVQFIIFLNLTEEPPKYDIAYSYTGEITSDVDTICRKIATFYIDSLTYLRLNAWGSSKNENGDFYDISIIKIPERFW